MLFFFSLSLSQVVMISTIGSRTTNMTYYKPSKQKTATRKGSIAVSQRSMPSSAKPLCYAALDHIIPLGDGQKAVPDLLLDLPAKPATRDSNKVGPERSCPQHVHLELLRINTIIMGQSSHKIFRAQDMIQLYHYYEYDELLLSPLSI